MKNTDLLYAMGHIDPMLIEEASPDAIKKRPQNRAFRKWATIAACLIFMLSVCFGSYAYTVVEAKDYSNAVSFFNEYNLSTDGLTRREIKKVYRDIVTESFTYAKTAEVLTSSLGTEQIPGHEIWQNDLTSKDLETLWDYIVTNINGVIVIDPSPNPYSPEGGVRYTKGLDSTGDFWHIKKYEDDVLIWSVPIPEFNARSCVATSDGVIVHGQSETTSSAQRSFSYVAKLDENGNLLWQHKMDNGFHWEYIESVIENADGTYTVFSLGVFERKGPKQLCFTQYSADGDILRTKITEIGNYQIKKATSISDGYLVQLCNPDTNEYAKVAKVDREGNVTNSVSYGSKESSYYIADMLEHNGKIYLSVYATPRSDRSEIAGILDYLCDNDILSISSEKLTPIVRANYTAMLLVCSSDLGTPEKFYSVEGSLGGRLSLSESGKLVWDAESIVTTHFSPFTSSFSIDGFCYVYRYTFDTATSTLISEEKTGLATGYRK